MAQIETTKTIMHSGRKKLHKKSTRVDLTPMVDLGFLLISFFVFTTTMARPKAMNIIMPDDKVPTADIICASCVLTVLLQKNNVVQYYEGIANAGTVLKETNFSPEGIRSIMLKKIKSLAYLKDREADDFVLIIKPTDESSFDSFVNMMDEAAINVVKHYYIADIDKEDEMLLAK